MTSKGKGSLLYKEHLYKKRIKMFQKNMGKCKFSPVKLAPWARPSPDLPRKLPPGEGSGGRRQANGSKDSVKSPRGEGLCLEWKRTFGWGAVGEKWVVYKQRDEATTRGWGPEKPAFWEVQEVYRNESQGVIYSLFSRFPNLTRLFWCENCLRALSFAHWPSRPPDLPL